MLSVGRINKVEFPQGHGIRVDTWIQPGCVILPVSYKVYFLLKIILVNRLHTKKKRHSIP